MAAACRSLSHGGGSVPEVVVDGVCGILVPPGSSEALAGALTRLLSSETERHRMGEAGRQRVSIHDAPLVAARFLEAARLAAAPRREQGGGDVIR